MALDREGHLLVIELKRTNDGGHAELQALRYAAMISSMTFDDVVDAYTVTLATPLGRELAGAELDPREDLTTFLDVGVGETPTLDDDVRIIIVAADFGIELTTAVLWLNRLERMDIRCIRLRPYRIENRTLLDVEQVILLREAAEYQVRMRRKEAAVRSDRVEAHDWTQYVVLAGGARSEPLRKRRTVLRMVQAVHDAGVPLESIQPAITGPRFLPVEGELTGDALKSAFVAAYPKAAGRLGRWFLEDPLCDDGRTWVWCGRWPSECTAGLARRSGAARPAGQLTVPPARSMSKRSLPNRPPAAVGGWVLHRSAMPLATRDEREHCECWWWLGWADEPGWCRQLEVTLENTDRLVGVSFI